MPDNPESKSSQTTEIDLLELFRRIARFFGVLIKGTGRGILVSIIFLLRNWIILSSSIIAGLAIAYLLKSTTPPSYRSDMVMRINSESTSEIIAYINRLNTFCREANYPALSRTLSIDEVQAKKIGDIEAFWLIDKGKDGIADYVDYRNKFNIYDTLNIRVPNQCDVRVILQNPEDLGQIQDGIKTFIESDSLFQRVNRVRMLHSKELLARMEYDISQLDSLQKVKYFEETRNLIPKSGGQMVFMQEHTTQLIYSDIHNLVTRKQQIETELNIYNDVTTILSGFSIPVKRINGGTFYALRIVPLLFGITLILTIIMHNRKRIKETFRKF